MVNFTNLDENGEVIEGQLSCKGCCDIYPITNGIPRFVKNDDYAGSFGFQWNKFRSEQIDSLNGIQQSALRFWSETKWDMDWMENKVLLDAGCGAGRFLEVASRNPLTEVVAVDLSGAVDAARSTLKGRKNVNLIQASIYALPLKKASFHGVYCIGVIQHTPDPISSIQALSDMVCQGGKLALTVYEKRRFTKFNGKYLIRPITRRLNNRVLLAIIKVLMPLLWLTTEILFRLPIVSKFFKFVIPVANYVDDRELSWKQRYNWAILDTFDALSPAFDNPQTEMGITEVLKENKFKDIMRDEGITGLNIIADK